MGFTNIVGDKNICPKLGQKVGEWHSSFECQHTKHANIYCTTRHVYVIDHVVNARRVAQEEEISSIYNYFSLFETRDVDDRL
jgi:hypothetical protein